jgi:carbamate kinase
VAHSQGGIGYLLIQALENAMRRAGIERQAACVVTQVAVDREDPAFQKPSKPIGPFFSREEALALEKKGWRMMEDAGRGWRYCVASPQPRAVINLGIINALLATGAVVIAGGGGGIPAISDAEGDWQGIEAVIDKDLTSALLARELGIRTLLILTAVERVAVDFGTPKARSLERVSVSELKAYQRAGHFAQGSMGPKIEAAIRHVEAGGERAIIAHLEHAEGALAGQSGTHVTPG